MAGHPSAGAQALDTPAVDLDRLEADAEQYLRTGWKTGEQGQHMLLTDVEAANTVVCALLADLGPTVLDAAEAELQREFDCPLPIGDVALFFHGYRGLGVRRAQVAHLLVGAIVDRLRWNAIEDRDVEALDDELAAWRLARRRRGSRRLQRDRRNRLYRQGRQ
jgi:hypothetical protein